MKTREFRKFIVIGTALIIAAVLCNAAFWGIKAGMLSLLSGTSVLAVFGYYTHKRCSEIEKLNDYLVRVLAGAKAPEAASQEEGELSILRTNIYKAATKLKTQNEMLSEDKKQLAAAIADISHQLKTPLTSMMVMNDLLTDEDDGAKRKELLKTQSSQLDRMNWLIQTLLKISKLDAGTIEMKKENVPAFRLVSEALRPFLIQLDVRNIKYETDICKENICCDINWTIEALQNIIKNCIEHISDGGRLSISASDTNIYSEILISDNGCGINADDLPHIFERFYKGSNAGKDSVGIGLALSKQILAAEHGEISANSKKGAGTTFTIRLYKTVV